METQNTSESIPERVRINTVRINKIETILFGDEDDPGDKGLFYDYIITKKLIKIIMWTIGIVNGIGLTLMGISLKYFLDLNQTVIRSQVLIEQLLKLH